jgi:GTP cyclohydrolase I
MSLTATNAENHESVLLPLRKMFRERAVEGIYHLLKLTPETLDSDNLKDTPTRVVRAFEEMTSGYAADIPSLFKLFEKGEFDEMVVLRHCPFTSICCHHLLNFSGYVSVGYLPGDKIIGLSKMARVVDAFAKRLQVQERLAVQITTAMMEHLSPAGAGCVITASHSCMSCRGVMKTGADMVTTCLRGVFKEDPRTRQEFLQAVYAK